MATCVDEREADFSRRSFLKGVMGAAGAAAALAAFDSIALDPEVALAHGARPALAGSDAQLSSADGNTVDVLERMRVELRWT